MIRKLLFVFSIVLGTVGIGWGQTPVATADALKAAITAAKEGATITLGANITLNENLVINGKTGVKIDGKGFSLLKSKAFTDTDDNFMTLVGCTNVTLNDINLNDSTASKQECFGLHVFSSTGVALEKVYITNFSAGGLLVNGSTVTANKLTTEGNAWGGIEVGKGEGVETDPALTITDCIITEPAQIWADMDNAPASWVSPADWTRAVKQLAGKGKQTFWTNSKLTTETADGIIHVYANGNPVTIAAGKSTGTVRISLSDKDYLVLPESANPIVFGGSKDATVASSTITMTGGTINRLYGGGYGSAADKKAGVTGTSTIRVTGGKVVKSLFGGGKFYAQSKNVDINISGLTIGEWLICGGDENGKTVGGNYPEFGSSNNTVESATLAIDGGTYGYIALGGTDGAKGYIKNTTATIKNATITGVFGNGSNGRSDKVVGVLTNCAFVGDEIEIAAINRGVAKSVSLSFEKCTFPTKGVYANLGATYRWGYNYNGSDAKVQGVPGEVAFSFNGCTNTPVMGISDGLAEANVTLTGAKAKMAKFEWNANQFHTAFTLGAGKTWTFNNGLEVADNCTLTNNGTLNTTVSTAADLLTAAALVNDGGKITLGKDIILTEKLWFEGKKNLTIDGGNFTLTKSNASGEADNFITLKNCTTATITNLKLNDASATKQAKSGLHVYTSTGVILTNVSITNFGGGGLIVNGSEVTASGLTTNGNAWGGINVDQGTGVTAVPLLTITNSAITDTKAKIWSDKAADVASWVNAPGWTMEVKDGKTYWNQAAVAPVLTAPTASTIEAGQSLSLSMLKGGSAKVADTATEVATDSITISGLFAWKNPADTALTTKSVYKVVFTPTDLTRYAATEIDVEIKNIKQYYIVTVGKSANGKVIVSPANAANKYAAGTTLTLTNEAEPNYKFLKLLGGATTSYKVTKDDVLTAEFAPILHTVTIATTDGGSVNINGTKKENAATVSVQQGSSLSVVAVPGDGKVLTSLTCSDSKAISNGTVTVDKPFTITAAFTATPASKFAVNTTITGNGKLLLFDASGNAIPAGSAVAGEISVLAVADQGYKAETISGATITAGKCTITAATTLSVTFTKQTYAVTKSTVTGATIAITGDGSTTLTAVPFGSELTATVTLTDDLKKTTRLLSLLVNGKEIPNGGKFTVTAATEVKAVMRTLATLDIDKATQTVVYDATAKAFVVKTTPAGVSGFTVTYGSETPTKAGDYTVTIKRDADDVYAAVNITDAKLTIEKAELKVSEPTFDANSKELVITATNGTYAWVGEQGKTSAIKEVTFTPDDKNYKLVTFSVWNHVGVAPETVNIPVQTRSGLRADANSLEVNPTGGTVEVLNGTTPATTMYVGQTLTLKAIPAAGNSAKATWTTGNATSTGETTTIKLTEGKNTVKATFAAKSAPVAPTINPTSTAYTGAIFGGKTPVAMSLGWNIVFKQNGTAIPAPTNAGTYAVFASCPADEFSAAVTDKNIGTFTITPVAATAAVKSATAILAGQSLAQSIITGTSDVDGTFEWVSPNTILTATAPSQSVVFVPKSANYTAPSGGMATSVTVTSTGVTLRTLNLTVTNPDKGTVTMKLNGAEVASGAMVTKGDKLTVTFAATAAGYTASATIAGVAYTSGATYTVAETGNVDVKVSYTINDSSSEVPSTGVSLNATTKTLAVGAEFTLVATVAPTSATSTGVSWASSDPTIATVDANGKVKALKAGTCKITVTTTEGGFTASCDVTVSLPTGIEEILANSRVYTRSGMICIDPAHPVDVVVVNMAGVMVYRDQLTDSRQISVSGGIYMVQLSDGKQVATVKVFVR